MQFYSDLNNDDINNRLVSCINKMLKKERTKINNRKNIDYKGNGTRRNFCDITGKEGKINIYHTKILIVGIWKLIWMNRKFITVNVICILLNISPKIKMK